MTTAANITYFPANLKATAILDVHSGEVRRLAQTLRQLGQSDREFAQKAHLCLCRTVRPIYTVDEWQPASQTLRKKKGSCSQRMACLEALARAAGIPTRVLALRVKGSFWYPRFQLSRPFIPRSVLLVWPQFLLDRAWVDFDELHAPMAQLAEGSPGFRNKGESLFEAVRKTPVDFLGKTCGLGCSKPGHDLSKYVLSNEGLFDTRDEVFERFGSFQHTPRGRLFEIVFGGRESS
jgi:transglutaminase-like putative cysteine protease